MPGEVRIQVDVEAARHYRFRVRSGTREITSLVDVDLATGFYEDLRLLRWKSVGLRYSGDILLSNVGDRLAGLIAPAERWQELGLRDEVRQVRVQFSQAAHHLMPFPWELLRVNNEFLIGAQGSHLVREAPAAAGRNRQRNPRINILHISLGTDSDLRFDEERAVLLETVPDSIPIEFLIDPSAGHLRAALDGFRPHIVIISGHGHYDDLRREHYLATGRHEVVPTAFLAAGCASYGCKLLVLSSCESARLGGSVVDEGAILPADLIAFTFPVKTPTAIQSIACFFRELVRGHSINEAMAAVRAIDIDDVYAFFNTVHLHRDRARSLRITDALPRLPGPPAPRCPGMELALGMLNSVAHTPDPITLLAAAGSGGDALIRHWAALVGRSQTMAARWRVLLDGVPILDAPHGQLVRLAYPHSYVPLAMEQPLYFDGMDREFAQRQLAERDADLARRMAKHPLLGMPGFVQDFLAGHTEQEAVEHFERENRMAERAARLNRDGIFFASSLFANQSYAATSFEDRAAHAELMQNLGIPGSMIVAGIENAVAAGVLLVRPDALLLAPEFMLLGDRWFPDWRTDHRRIFDLLCMAFDNLAAGGDVDLTKESRLLDWAMRLEDWDIAVKICIAICRWYGERGRLEAMTAIIERLLPHATGMRRIILRGHLVSIATKRGDFPTSLTENQTLETELQAMPDHPDYMQNLQATIAQQIACLLELGRLDEAEERWRDAHALLPRLTEHRSEAEARLLGQLAQLRREQEVPAEALAAATQAVELAVDQRCPAVLIAELRHTKADLLRLEGRDREAITEINATARVPMGPELRSRFLHLKGLILERYDAPDALNYFLESYEIDLQRGDHAGVAISLLSIARIYFEEHEYDRARERIREALPLAENSGLVGVVARLSLMWGEIDVAEGKDAPAVTWLNNARNKFTEDHDDEGAARATRLLDALRGR